MRCLWCAVLVLTLATSSWGQVVYQRVALSDDPVPGSIWSQFSTLQAPVINNNGQLAFMARITNVDPLAMAGIWKWDASNGLSHLMQSDDLAPGTGGKQYNGLGGLNISDTDQVSYVAGLNRYTASDINSLNDSGLWAEDASGQIQLVARESDPAPGIPGAQWDDFLESSGEVNHYVFSAQGQVALSQWVRTSDAALDRGLWMGEPGQGLSVVLREGDAAPGAAGSQFSNFMEVGINPSGEVAFTGSLSGVGVTVDSKRGVWGPDNSGSLALIAREGAAAPGAGGGRFSIFYGPAINELGQVAFYAGLIMGENGVDQSNSTGVWGPDTNGQFALLARVGSEAADSGGTDFIAISGQPPLLNATGDTAFFGYLNPQSPDDGVNTQGIWVHDHTDGIRALVIEGQDAPGIPGAVFDRFADLTMNAVGDVVFEAVLRDSDGQIDSFNNTTLWFYSADLDQLILLARQDDYFDVDPDPLVEDLRRIYAFDWAAGGSGSDGLPRSLNDHGVFSFQLRFDGGEYGVFTAYVPEPGSVLLLLAAAAGFIRRR